MERDPTVYLRLDPAGYHVVDVSPVAGSLGVQERLQSFNEGGVLV